MDPVDAEGNKGVRLDETEQELDAQQGNEESGDKTGDQEIDLGRDIWEAVLIRS